MRATHRAGLQPGVAIARKKIGALFEEVLHERVRAVQRVGSVGVRSHDDVARRLVEAPLVGSPIAAARLHDDAGAFGLGDGARPVGGIPIDDEQFEVPATRAEGVAVDAIQRGPDSRFFVERRDQDRDLHPFTFAARYPTTPAAMRSVPHRAGPFGRMRSRKRYSRQSRPCLRVSCLRP